MQRITIAGDLLFGGVARLRPPDDEIGHSPRRRGDPLDAIGRFSGLDHGVSSERVELFRELTDEEVLSPARLAKPMDGTDVGGPEAELGQVAGVRGRHVSGGSQEEGNT